MPIGLTALWPDLLLPFAWGGLVGLVFSLVGAAGGILASFGLISVLGGSPTPTRSNPWPKYSRWRRPWWRCRVIYANAG